jgi:predicted exporter
MNHRYRPLALGVAVLLALGIYVAVRFEVTTDIYAFLPEADDRELGALSRQIAQSELSRTMIFAITAPDTATAVRASRMFERALRREPSVAREIAFLEGGPADGVERGLFELYEPRRFAFLAPDAAAARARISQAGLQRAAFDLRDALGGPMSPLLSRVAPRDPLLILPALFERLEASAANDLTIRDGRFLASDERTSVLFLGTRHSAFDADVQAPVLAGINRVFARVDREFGGRLTLDQSGLNRFATRAATAIKGDIERVSTLSLVLIGALLFALFRSLRLVALASIPVGAGVLAGSFVVLLLFGRIHGITVAFGASLIGVAVDYVVHVYCFHALHTGSTEGDASFTTIGRSLTTGAATTITGFLALAPSSLAGLREVACFAVTGMFAAFLATRYMLPALMPKTFRAVPLRARVISTLARGFDALRTQRRWLWVFPAATAVFIAIVLPRARWNDDFASLGRLDPGILAEDARVREKVTHFEQMRFVVALGDTEERALQASERIHAVLGRAEADGELEGHRTISLLLPSARTQREVADVVYSDATLRARFAQTFTDAGFATAGFEPFFAALTTPRPRPLTHDDLISSPLASMIRPFRIALDGRVGFVTFVHGVTDADAIEARLRPIRDAVFLRQSDLFGRAHREYQERTLTQLGLGLVAVFLVLSLRYRNLRRTCAVLVPSVLSVGVTVCVLTLLGRGLDLVTLTALLFVVSMGDDYGVFLVDALTERDETALSAALLGVLIACVTTLVGFGLLAFSEHPVLSGLGITAAAGITASVILSPTTLLFLRPEEGDR